MPIQRRPHADWRSANRLKGGRDRMSILLRLHKAGRLHLPRVNPVAGVVPYFYAASTDPVVASPSTKLSGTLKRGGEPA